MEYICLPTVEQTAFILLQKENPQHHNFTCERNERIAIFSSIFTNNVSGNTVECLEVDVTHIVSRICHGHKACTVSEEAMVYDRECNFIDIHYACMDSVYFNYEFLRHIEENYELPKEKLYIQNNFYSEDFDKDEEFNGTGNYTSQGGVEETANYIILDLDDYDSSEMRAWSLK